MKLSDTLSGLGRTVAYYPGLAKLIGVKECVLLCQFIYWRDKSCTADGWVYKSRDDIENETGLSHEEQSTARKRLKALGLWEEENNRWEHKMLYRVNLDGLNTLWEEAESARRRETVDHGVGKPQTTVSVYISTRVPPKGGEDDASLSNPPREVFPQQLRDDGFIALWRRWEQHLSEIGKGMGGVQRDQVWRQCIESGLDHSILVISTCIDAGYRRLVWDIKIRPKPRAPKFELEEDRMLREAAGK